MTVAKQDASLMPSYDDLFYDELIRSIVLRESPIPCGSSNFILY